MLHMTQAQERLFPRPAHFRSAEGVTWAEFSPIGPFGTQAPVPQTEAQRIGLRYERKVHEHFSRRFSNYGASQWISYKCGKGFDVRWAQPDGLMLDMEKGQVTIIEIKIRHTERAWWQLRQLYEPLVKFLFPQWTIGLCEVCRTFDPAVAWPEPFHFTPPNNVQPGQLAVYPLERPA
jgi:hypothetical protein